MAKDCDRISLQLPHGRLLDLHWHVVSNRMFRDQLGLDIRRMFDGTDRVALDNGLAVPTPAAVDHLLYVALHAALSGGHQLRWLVDVAEATRWAAPSEIELRDRGRALSCDLAMDVMALRVRRAFGRPAADLPRVGRSSSWLALCAVTDAVAAPEVATSGGGPSGRAVFSSTRTSFPGSVRPLVDNLRAAARRSGRDRPIDRSVLHLPGGTEADRLAWLRYIEQHG